MKRKKLRPGKIVLYIILIIAAFFTIYPFLWMISASFKPLREILGGGLSLWSPNMTLENYTYIIGRSTLFPLWFLNSFIVAILGTIINLFLNTMAGYSLARLHFRGRDTIFFLFLAFMMVPAQVLLIPNFLILRDLRLLNSLAALIIPSAANIANIFMMRQFFINFPADVEEAAAIDGLGRFGRFFRICFPLARPIIATQAIFVFMGFWNEFVRAMLYLTNPRIFTLTLGLQTFQSRNAGTEWSRVMAMACISVLPIIILYLIFNKFFLVGLRMDGEK